MYVTYVRNWDNYFNSLRELKNCPWYDEVKAKLEEKGHSKSTITRIDHALRLNLISSTEQLEEIVDSDKFWFLGHKVERIGRETAKILETDILGRVVREEVI